MNIYYTYKKKKTCGLVIIKKSNLQPGYVGYGECNMIGCKTLKA